MTIGESRISGTIKTPMALPRGGTKKAISRPDINKWMYINSSGTKKWYAKGDEPSGYDIYERTASSGAYLGATALPGERLVLYAIWQ